MAEIALLKGVQTFEKTMPMMIYRLFVYLMVAVGYIAATLFGTGTGFGLGSMGNNPASVSSLGAVIGFGLCCYALYRMRSFFLFNVRASHVGLLTKALEEQSLATGMDQVGEGKALVLGRFSNAHSLMAIDQSIRKVLMTLHCDLTSIGRQVAGIGNDYLARIAKWIVSLPIIYTNELVIGFVFRQTLTSPNIAVKTALVYYAQNFKEITKTSISLFVSMIAGLFIMFFLLRVPMEWISANLPFSIGMWGYVFTLILAWSIKAAIIEPIALSILMTQFFRMTEEQAPNPEWESKLSQISIDFDNLLPEAKAN